jgi:hypothetical protein
MQSVEERAQGYLADSAVDWVGLWEVAAHARQDCAVKSDPAIRARALAIVRRMHELGLRGGENDETATWRAWPDEGAEGLVRRVDQAWSKHLRERGERPSLGTSLVYFSPVEP